MNDIFTSQFLKRLEHLALLSRKVFAGKARGERRSTKRGASVEFADFRNYVAGDDLRHLDWHAYARLGELFLRLYIEEEDLSVHILLDTSRSMGYGDPNKFDAARQTAAALAYIALSNLDRVSIIAFRERRAAVLPLSRGTAQIFSVFEFLRRLQPDGGTSLQTTVEEFVSTTSRKGLVLVLSDYLDPAGYERSLQRLLFDGFDVAALQVLAPQEVEPDFVGDFRLVDSERGTTVDLSVTARVAKLYERRVKQFCADLETFCRRHGMGILSFRTDVPLEDLMLRFLRGAGIVG